MPSIYLYITDTLADWECGHVLAELHSGRFLKDPSCRHDLVLCGRTMDPQTTMGGVLMVPKVLFTDIHPKTGDLVLLPGADTWLDPAQGPVIEKIRMLLDEGVVVAAICGATMALANAGLLDKRPHTSNDLAALKMFCPGYHGEEYYSDDPAATDGNLITAGSFAPVEFATHIFRRLDVMSPETLAAWHGLFTTRKPIFFYALMESLPKRA
ncbi:glutamine amidotransferase [Methanocalculus taiwanensis]|uniref:Glutamine amidotransferase n=1 Tax=Methanocalculus taiwanensis TaxID=106207 RepID=A0ABD4TLC6_9EURY|nr:DJ-1/PfpI family protein [Methanocalculus taiwanensis]MCQ1538357.1 glutamine amidotransferase [Methanocalculus taiwanensis]